MRYPSYTPDSGFLFSYSQRRLLSLYTHAPSCLPPSVSRSYRLTGPLDQTTLRKALIIAQFHYAILRTPFSLTITEAQSCLTSNDAAPVKFLDLRHLPKNHQHETVHRLLSDEMQRPFDPLNPPLLRLDLLQLKDDEHILAITVSPLVADGDSINLFMQDLISTYNDVCEGSIPRLHNHAPQYRDFAIWQTNVIDGASLHHWRSALNAMPTLLDLPLDFPRPPTQCVQYASHSVHFPSSLFQSAVILSDHMKTSTDTVLSAAWILLLHRLAAQDDIAVGWVTTYRSQRAFRHTVGPLTNVQILRIDLRGAPTFLELVQRIIQTRLSAGSHAILPIEQLIEELSLTEPTSHGPLYQVAFNAVPSPELNLGTHSGLIIHGDGYTDIPPRVDLCLSMRYVDTNCFLNLDYNTYLFAPDRVQEMLHQLLRVLEQVIADPAKRISSVSLLTDSAKTQLPNPSSALNSDWQGSIQGRLVDHARHSPDSLAVVGPNTSWTYEELNIYSNRLARALRDRGVHPGDIVAIYGTRSAALVAAVFGVLKSGAAFLLLDPSLPTARLVEQVRAVPPKAWLQLEPAYLPPDLEHVLSSFGDYEGVLVPTSESLPAAQQLSKYRPDDIDVDVGRSDVASIVFTSGSTGKPKAIAWTHGPVTHFFPWYEVTYNLTPDDRFCMIASLSAGGLQRDIFTPIWLGATLYIPSPEEMDSPSRLMNWFQETRISVAHLTPALCKALATALPINEGRSPALHALRCVFFVGDALTWHDIELLRMMAPQALCVNRYGVTEAHGAQAHYPIPISRDVQSDAPSTVVPVGWGIPGVQFLLTNSVGGLAGIGEVGELYIRSPHLAAGYVGDPELTRSHFIEDTKSYGNAERHFRTNDLGRYSIDGTLDILGRTDAQVKIRGFRVNLNEIEGQLAQYPAVGECVVTADTSTPGDSRLIAYVVLRLHQHATVSELRDFLSDHLPGYMLPNRFVFLTELPHTSTGKVDRRNLPVPADTRPDLDRTYVAPQGPLQVALAQMWSDILSVSPIGAEDDYFDLGGDSLFAAQLVSQIRDTWHVDLSMRALFEHPTVAGLAMRIAEAQTEQPTVGADVVPVVLPGVVGSAPLLPEQRDYLVSCVPDTTDAAWAKLSLMLDLDTRLTPSLLHIALQAVVGHHDGLRSHLVFEDNTWHQTVKDGDLSFKHIDMDHTPPSLQEEIIQEILISAMNEVSYFSETLVHFVYFERRPRERDRLLIVAHHLFLDLVSIVILLIDINSVCNQILSGRRISLPPKTTSPREWAVRLTAYARSADPVRDGQYWLSDRWQNLPRLLRTTEWCSETGLRQRHLFVLAASDSEMLLRIAARRLGVSPEEVVTAAVIMAMALRSGRQIIPVGFTRHGRHDVLPGTDLSRTIGWFAAGYPMLVSLEDVGGFEDVLATVREEMRMVHAHGLACLGLRLSESEHVANILQHVYNSIEVWIDYQVHKVQTYPLFDLTPAPTVPLERRVDRDRVERVISITVRLIDGCLHMEWDYHSGCYAADTVAALADDVGARLQSYIDEHINL